jgi:small GTP-binding protein
MKKREIMKKVCLLGDSQVGKTSLIRRYVHDQFDDMYIMTFGAKVSSKNVKLYTDEEEITVTLAIWDIIGEHGRRYLQASHYKGASGALVVCDCTRSQTFDHLSDWVHAFHQTSPDGKLVFLMNKIDLQDTRRVTLEDLGDIGEVYKSSFFASSAKTDENVELAFKTLSEDMVLKK